MAKLNCFQAAEWPGYCSVCDSIENAAVECWKPFSCAVYFAIRVYADLRIAVRLDVVARLPVADEALHLVAATVGCDTGKLKKGYK